MLHDVILALSGIGGEVLGIFLDDEIFAVSLLIHPCEKTLLKRLMSISDSYKCLQNFIKKVPHFGKERIKLDDESSVMPGMYLRAFCSGMYDSLEPYRSCLISLEKEVLENPDFTLSGILAHVSGFSPLFTTLNSVINKIVVQKLHGCQILQILHEHLSTGVAMVDTVMARIMQCCHLVMLKQLTSWLLYGHLIDPYSEFFIEPCAVTPDALYASSTTLDTESLPDSVLNDCAPEYRIVQSLVPSYIPPSIPETVKYIGSTVVSFSGGNCDGKLAKSQCYRIEYLFRNDIKTICEFFANFGTDSKIQDSLFSDMESSLLEQCKELQNCPVLNISFLESVIDNVRSRVTQHVYSLAKDKANLLGELRLVKEFYLLGRGELFVSFLRKANNALFKSVSNNSSRDLSNLLYAATRDVQLNSDVIMEKFSFKVPPKDAVAPKAPVLSVMSLEYSPPWPLHLLFNPSTISSYNTLFSFLLQVKIAELNLHDVWIENIKRKDNPWPQEVWTLRNCLMFLVHNLQCYLQLDVLESEYSIFQAALDKTEDFDQVIHEHSIFLKNITTQAFLFPTKEIVPDQPPIIKRHPVNRCITDILKLCKEFCLEMSKEDISDESLKAMIERLDLSVSMLMSFITLLGGKAEGLRLLLLRLDYNRFFSLRSS